MAEALDLLRRAARGKPLCFVAPVAGVPFEVCALEVMPSGLYVPTVGIATLGPYVALVGSATPPAGLPWPWPVMR